MWLYVRVPVPVGTKAVLVRNTVLFNAYDDELNQLNILDGQTRQVVASALQRNGGDQTPARLAIPK